MKKAFSLILVSLMLTLSFVSCSGGGIDTGDAVQQNNSTETESTALEGEAELETSAPEGKSSEEKTEKPEETKEEEYVYTPDSNNKYTGGVGVGTYSTSVTYSSVKVVNNADRKTLLNTKFENLDGWNYVTTGGGTWDSSKTDEWSVGDGGVTFTDTSSTGATIWTGDTQWGNYNLTVKGTANEGAEALRVFFAYTDENNYYVFNVGGWGNTVACVQCFVDGKETDTDKIPMTLKYGEEYTISVNVKPDEITGFVNSEQIFQIGGGASDTVFKGAAGFGHWSTEAYVDNIKVVSFTDGSVLYENNFDDAASLDSLKHDLEPYSGGTYDGDASVFEWEDGTLHQTNSSMTGIISYFGDTSWSNYIYTMDVMPVAGAEGATILGAIDLDTPSYILYNCGGWSNTVGCWQTYDAGTTNSYNDAGIDVSLSYDEWHRLSLVVLDYAIFSYIDGEFFQAYWS